MGFHNIIDGHGLGIMLTGMLIVFFGLSLLSGFIIVLSRLAGSHQVAAAHLAPAPKVEKAEPTVEELLAVTSLVIYMESERSLGEWTHSSVPRQSRRGSIWTSAGKMRSLSEGGSHA